MNATAVKDQAWADAWIDALSKFSHPGRMRRGLRFADRRHVRKFEVLLGQVHADVTDEGQTSHVRLDIRPFDDATWRRVVSHLASQARFSARLLAGEIPSEVINVFTDAGAPLFPGPDELHSDCTCPDWQAPCKHVAAIYFVLADKFEQDPFQLFLLRGRSREQLLAELRQQRQPAVEEGATSGATETVVVPPLAETLSTFWDLGADLEDVSFTIAPPPSPAPHLRRLGPAPFTYLNLIELLTPVYGTVTATALQMAYPSTGQKP